MSEVDKTKTNAEWREELSSEQFYVARQGGTERPGSHPYNYNKDSGTYKCICCGKPLFASETKYESGSGWPSFYQPIAEGAVAEKTDTSHGMVRTEVKCAECSAHLGHVFPDGPQPTGLRYCMNGTALDFEKS